MDKKIEDFLIRVSEHFCDGTMDYDDFYRFAKMAKIESVPEAVALLNKMLSDLGIDKQYVDADGDVEMIASLLFHYSQFASNFRNAYAGGMDNIDFITRIIASIVYNLFSKADKKFTALDIFKLAINLDLKYYIKSGYYQTKEICEKVEKVIKDNVLDLDSEYNYLDYINESNKGLTSVVVKLVVLALCLIFKVDNSEMEEDGIVNLVFGKCDHINDIVCNLFNDDSLFMKDEQIRRSVDGLLTNDELIQDILSSDIDLCGIDCEIEDLDEYDFVDYSYNIAGTGFTVEDALNFLYEIDGNIDHVKEHNDYLVILKEKRSEVASSIRQEIPNLNTDEVLRMKSSVDLGNIKIAGICYLFGVGVERNFEECFNLFMRGVDLLDGESAYQISCMYLKSLFVQYNDEKWIEYLSLACKLGEENAIGQWKELKDSSEKYYAAKEQAKRQFTKEVFIAKVIKENKRSPAPLIIFWPLFLQFLIIGIIVVATVSLKGIILLIFSGVFFILALVKTIQYVNSKKFIDEIKDK